jgi:hypothetical protein
LVQLDPILERFAPPGRRRVELRSIRMRAVADAPPSAIKPLPAVVAEWRMVGTLALPWSPTLDLLGTTAFSYDPNENGRVVRYDETWVGGPLAALAQLLQPGPREAPSAKEAAAAGAAAPATALPAAAARPRLAVAASVTRKTASVIAQPEHWPGRLTGALPPTPLPAACLKRGEGVGVSVVVLPGFGNCAGDYATPLGQPADVGLVACLKRRGFIDVTVLEVRPRTRSNSLFLDGETRRLATILWASLYFLVRLFPVDVF